jgi:hypothetical protein
LLLLLLLPLEMDKNMFASTLSLMICFFFVERWVAEEAGASLSLPNEEASLSLHHAADSDSHLRRERIRRLLCRWTGKKSVL